MYSNNPFLKNVTFKVNEVFKSAVNEALNLQIQVLMPEFVLYTLTEQKNSIVLRVATELRLNEIAVKNSIVNNVFASIQENSRYSQAKTTVSSENLYGTKELEWLLEKAELERKAFNDAYISTATLFLGFFDARLPKCREILESAGIRYEEAKRVLLTLHKNHTITSRDDENKQSILDEFTIDLTEMARLGVLDPVAERQGEIERIIQILSRRRKNNPILVGEAGVGKSVIVEGLAQRIISQDVPDYLLNKRILSLEMSDVVAGTKLHGEFEERLKKIKEEIIAQQGEIILFIDEIHTIVGAGKVAGAIDASNILKSSLAKGQLQCIGATTFKEYKTYFRADSALERRFQPVQVAEPTLEAAKKMLRISIPKYEGHHRIKYSEKAIDAAVDLSSRYIFNRCLPDKAVDLIDEAGAQKRIQVVSEPIEIKKLEREKLKKQEERSEHFEKQDFAKVAEIQVEISTLEKSIAEIRVRWNANIREDDRIVKEDDITKIISKTTGIPIEKLRLDDYRKLLQIEEVINRRIIGQPSAVAAVANAIRRNRIGLRQRKAPIGSFLFLGPTGVGKTELAKVLCDFMLNDEQRIVRFDMSEYMEKHEAAKLIGSPPGYIGYGEGGQLTEKIRQQPHSVILLDEIEKAHPDIFNMFLQILDDGRLTDSEGQVVNFENTIIIFTSNLGSEYVNTLKKTVGLGDADKHLNDSDIAMLVSDEVKKNFRPEFLNRIDEIIIFNKLGRMEIEKIFNLHMENMEKRLNTLGVSLTMTLEAREYLIRKSFDSIYGARYLRRTLEKEVENLIAEEIIKFGIMQDSNIPKNILLEMSLLDKNTLQAKVLQEQERPLTL